MALKHTIDREVTKRLRGPNATTEGPGQLKGPMGAGDYPAFAAKLQSCALACGVPPEKLTEAIEGFRAHALQTFGEAGADEGATDDFTEGFFASFARRKSPTTTASTDPPSGFFGPRANEAPPDPPQLPKD